MLAPILIQFFSDCLLLCLRFFLVVTVTQLDYSSSFIFLVFQLFSSFFLGREFVFSRIQFFRILGQFFSFSAAISFSLLPSIYCSSFFSLNACSVFAIVLYFIFSSFFFIFFPGLFNFAILLMFFQISSLLIFLFYCFCFRLGTIFFYLLHTYIWSYPDRSNSTSYFFPLLIRHNYEGISLISNILFKFPVTNFS